MAAEGEIAAPAHKVVGQRLARVDARERVTGEARYPADLALPGMVHARHLRSPHAHARIRRIDTTRASALRGVLAVVTASYLILRRVTRSPFGMVLQSIRENEARTRAIGYPVERYKIVAVMLSGLFAGLAGVLYAIQNEFAAPDFVYFITSGDTVIFNVMGGIGTLVGPIVGAGFFLLLREAFSRFFTEHYLIPVGVIFVAMVIFMPQGLVGFAKRWLNR